MKRTLLIAALAAITVSAGPARAFDLNSMTQEERATFQAEIRAYLLQNPEVIMEAVQILEDRQAAQEAEAGAGMIAANAEALFDDGYSYIGGNPEGDVTLVEFLDYRCGYCKRAHPEVAELLASDGNIRLIVKEFPILGEESTLSSRFAIAVKQVAGSEHYKTVGDYLMTFRGQVTEAALRRASDELGLDTDAIMARMDSDDVAAEITANRALAQRLQIGGTPTFVVGSELIRGYIPLNAMQERVAAAREG